VTSPAVAISGGSSGRRRRRSCRAPERRHRDIGFSLRHGSHFRRDLPLTRWRNLSAMTGAKQLRRHVYLDDDSGASRMRHASIKPRG